jgi:hypothetical protein
LPADAVPASAARAQLRSEISRQQFERSSFEFRASATPQRKTVRSLYVES